jgi:anti-sigma factor RsiW
MTCKEVYDLVMAYLDNELPPDERAEFENHLYKCCPSCGAYLASYQETVRLARQAGRSVSQDDVPPKLLQAILANAPRDGHKS